MSVLDLTTVANNCFAVTKEGTEMTAEFGGEALDKTAALDTAATPDATATFDPIGMG
ncbi:MAG: hypothetical protein KAJ86_07335 [Alphaproteobacteria bacterium]|nr:hypothetical protein [Alphaproteobacteria bacterium]